MVIHRIRFPQSVMVEEAMSCVGVGTRCVLSGPRSAQRSANRFYRA